MSHFSTDLFLRLQRRAAGLSQEELTRMLGLRDRSHLSYIERGKQALQLEQAFRYQVLFGVPMEELMPTFCGRILNSLWEDVTATLGADTGGSDNRSKGKRKLLQAALARIESFDEKNVIPNHISTPLQSSLSLRD